ncbi:hypothetical protein LOTGIDRAFT_237180 [Lottia gigantea]|uniref:ODAD1 central coiled coil region domain-containing protein n=1 Tax=Lottia gigantea TaxID=225164 RepID=V3ZD76_LOTGI|nr:hypothetical protein LOTGIDRAFT_237180 [Lottia gigantea]ESO81977.1 hypothetical protein LOTGIDRAFT_237180 [Lottia gigantea]
MPGSTAVVQRPTAEQIDELKSKISLLEGDRKAYYESASYAIKQNRENIQSLRKETQSLRKRLSDKLNKDQDVIGKAFHDRPVERAALSNKSGKQAITVLDHKVSDTAKRLNALRHQTATKQKKLEECQTQLLQMKQDTADAKAMDTGESQEAQTMRYLENSYDKVAMKCEEAKQVQRVYLDIKDRFEKEAQNYPLKLDSIEAEIKKTRGELNDLKSMQTDATLARDAAQKDLAEQEEYIYSERKKREVELHRMKKEAEEKKMQHERIEKRLAQRGSIQQDELTTQDKMALTGEEQQQIITTYEEAFRRIKEATGVSDTMEVVRRFENQDDTTKHLEDLKLSNEKHILRLKEDKGKLQDEFAEMKYSGEAKLSSGELLLEEYENHLQAEEARRDEADHKLQRSSKVLVQVKAGVEHLSDKLHHLKANKGHVPTAQIQPSSDEYVLDQLSTGEEKLLKLVEELDAGGTDVNAIMKQMEEEEFHASAEGRLPTYNTRIKLPQTQRDLVYSDENDSGDDDIGVPNRHSIKKQSQFIIDSKTKRRVAKKKKKTK